MRCVRRMPDRTGRCVRLSFPERISSACVAGVRLPCMRLAGRNESPESRCPDGTFRT